MTIDFAGRVPPQSKDAEQGVLSAMIRDADCVEDVTAAVRADEFYFDAHQKIFRAVADLVADGRPVDLPILYAELSRRRQSEDVGGAAFLADLFDAVPTAANALYHAAIVRDCAKRRHLAHIAAAAWDEAMRGGRPAAEMVADFEAKAFDLADAGNDQAAAHIKPFVFEEIARLDTLGTTDAAILGIPTGFRCLDDVTGGWVEGLYVIGARPSVGKSAFMLTSALAAAGSGFPVLLFSLEMPPVQLVRRDLAILSGIGLTRFRTNKRLSDFEAGQIRAASEKLMGSPLFLNIRPRLRLADILATTRQMVRKRGVRVVFVDYLQIIKPDDVRASKVDQLETVSRELKLLSAHLRIPVVCLAQLNRVAAERENEKPKLSDFRGSGSIEQDADDCYLLWRAEANPNADVWKIGLDVAKQRNGPTTELAVSFRRSCARFEERAVDC